MDEKVAMWRSVMETDRRKRVDFGKFWKKHSGVIIKGVLLILLVLVPCVVVHHNTVAKMEEEFAVQMAEAVARTEQETVERLAVQYGTVEESSERAVIDAEAKVLAKMLYAYRYNSDEGLKSACWCALNRVDSKYYPNTVQGVCEQKSQWMGWSEDNPVMQKLYDVAYEQLALWHNGVHLVDPDFVYMEWTSQEITLRTNFTGKGHFWYESDWANA